MRSLTLAVAAAVIALSSTFSPAALADEPGVTRKARVAKKVCVGPKCGPYAPCGARCRVVCPDGYSCKPLYGAYGPYGGVAYWGGYTLTGWGRW